MRTPDPGDDPPVFPLAIPLLAGPGAITAIILLTDQPGGDPLTTVGVFAKMIATYALVFPMFPMASSIERVRGDTEIPAVTRRPGIVLSVLRVQFVLDGLPNVSIG